jgi:hypothetical protein
MAEFSLEPILAYLKENYGRYSLGILHRQLLENGYDPGDVDWAIQIFQQENPAARSRVWPWALLIVAFNTALMVPLSRLSNEQYWILRLVIGAFLICCGELVIGLLLKIPWQTRHLSRVLLRGLALFVGLGIVALGGLCTGIIR